MADRIPTAGSGPETPRASVDQVERVKLTAAYLNTAAGGLFTAGVVAPLAAAVFGITGPVGGLPALILIIGITIFLGASVALHIAGRIALRGLDR